MLLSKNSEPEKRLYKLPSLKDNFGLTKKEFDQCVLNLKKGVDGFLVQSLANQLPESMNYLQNKFRISREDSYDLCMETFLDFRTKIINDKIQYGNLRFLYTRMCVNTFLDQKRKEQKVKEGIDLFNYTERGSNSSSHEFFEKLDKFLLTIPEDQKSLLEDLYYSEIPMEEIAKSRGISYPNLRKKKERLIKSLRIKFFETKSNF